MKREWNSLCIRKHVSVDSADETVWKPVNITDARRPGSGPGPHCVAYDLYFSVVYHYLEIARINPFRPSPKIIIIPSYSAHVV